MNTTNIKCACRHEEALHREGGECHAFTCRCEKYLPAGASSPEVKNPAVTFRVTSFTQSGAGYHYEILIHRENGESVTRGLAVVGEPLQISREEMAGDEEEPLVLCRDCGSDMIEESNHKDKNGKDMLFCITCSSFFLPSEAGKKAIPT